MIVRNYEEENHNSSHQLDDSMEAPLDKDGDGYLSDAELLPIIGKIHPSEHDYAKQQADYIILQADTDKDGRLTLTEMIENPYVFYSVIFNDDEEEDYQFHDEFRYLLPCHNLGIRGQTEPQEGPSRGPASSDQHYIFLNHCGYPVTETGCRQIKRCLRTSRLPSEVERTGIHHQAYFQLPRYFRDVGFVVE
ncbi:Calcium-binding EF hand family protein [Prunus dulcis]|uniref:Calcium-binding EF hand family protein n=1 Tax=Prunus dulcis TaxID=3755 RepID=A0A5H2YAJ7_PRUDU|nr:Calcium-binding EF hand family protein [Prunus dulcis]